MFDILIKEGTIIDGSGNARFEADIGINEDQITAIGTLSDARATRTIEAKNLIVSPGFIDIHSHSDYTLLVNPKGESKIRQGVTTEVIGNCGISAFPLLGQKKEEVAHHIKKKYGLDLSWDSFPTYVSVLRKSRLAINVIPLLGYNTVRASIAGFADVPLSEEQTENIKKIIEDYMKNGGFGLSSGLIYEPGIFAGTRELTDACCIVAKYNGIYATHMRGEDHRVLDSVREAIVIAKNSGVSLQISHLKILGTQNWNLIEELISLVQQGHRDVHLLCDQYPYVASFKTLRTVLPGWCREGGKVAILKRLNNQENRELLRKELVIQWSNIILSHTSCSKYISDAGQSLFQISDVRKEDVVDVLSDILIGDIETKAVFFNQCEENVEKIMQQDFVMICSDGYATDNHGILSAGSNHPRDFGAFPRVIAKYVRELKVISLEDAIRKMTSLPAKQLGLKNRGLLRKDMVADITLFDFDIINDEATFEYPNKYAKGVNFVLINGIVVIDHGIHNGVLVGEVLRK